MAEYDEEDRRLLKMKRAMDDFYGTPGWKVFAELVEAQIKEREKIVLQQDIEGGMEPIVMLLRLERVKGAIMGLKLALENPRLIIEQGQAILTAHRNARVEEED